MNPEDLSTEEVLLFPKKSSEQQVDRPKKLSRNEIEKILQTSKNLAGFDLSGLDLAELPLKGVSFVGCNACEISLGPPEGGSEGADIRETNWINATFATLEEFTVFKKVNAEGAIFGFIMTTNERDQMISEIQKKAGRGPNASECGRYINFNGSDANFQKTKWLNIRFGGSGYGAFFPGANFNGAVFEGCNFSRADEDDLSGTDFSEAEIVGIQIINPESLAGLKIRENQVSTVFEAIIFSDDRKLSWEKAKAENEPRELLEKKLGIIIVSNEINSTI